MDFGVYIHWPFCAAKCPYCDFNSHVRHNGIDQASFVEAYEREIETIAGYSPGREVTSIFFGGGTPSLMHPSTLDAILNAISKNWSISDDAEITLEANPSSVEANRFAAYRASGVNRVSLGVQSLDDHQLKFLGRLHNAEEAIGAIEIAAKTFDRYSFDLIYARPNQTAQNWKEELSSALKLADGHMSLYQLTIEQETPFFELFERGKLVPLTEEPSSQLYELTHELMQNEGYEHYEISNFAMPEQESRHNLVYWRGEDYAGIGPGAHGRISTNEGRLATSMIKHPETWWQELMVKGAGFEEKTVLSQEDIADEFLLMGLRLSEGISPDRYREVAGKMLDPEQVEFLTNINMLETLPNENLRATSKGFLVLDAVVADLASSSEKLL